MSLCSVWISNVAGVIFKLCIQAFTVLLNVRIMCGGHLGLSCGVFSGDMCVCVVCV